MELSLRRVTDDVFVPDDEQYIDLVRDILESPVFAAMKDFVQHGTTSCLDHCISVSYRSYLSCLEYGLDARAAARGGLLHDMFLYDWHDHFRRTGDRFHGLSHPKAALENAEREFSLTDTERDIILHHMWPLTPRPPRTREAYVVLYHDKACSLRETLGMTGRKRGEREAQTAPR